MFSQSFLVIERELLRMFSKRIRRISVTNAAVEAVCFNGLGTYEQALFRIQVFFSFSLSLIFFSYISCPYSVTQS